MVDSLIFGIGPEASHVPASLRMAKSAVQAAGTGIAASLDSQESDMDRSTMFWLSMPNGGGKEMHVPQPPYPEPDVPPPGGVPPGPDTPPDPGVPEDIPPERPPGSPDEIDLPPREKPQKIDEPPESPRQQVIRGPWARRRRHMLH